MTPALTLVMIPCHCLLAAATVANDMSLLFHEALFAESILIPTLSAARHTGLPPGVFHPWLWRRIFWSVRKLVMTGVFCMFIRFGLPGPIYTEWF